MAALHPKAIWLSFYGLMPGARNPASIAAWETSVRDEYMVPAIKAGARYCVFHCPNIPEPDAGKAPAYTIFQWSVTDPLLLAACQRLASYWQHETSVWPGAYFGMLTTETVQPCAGVVKQSRFIRPDNALDRGHFIRELSLAHSIGMKGPKGMDASAVRTVPGSWWCDQFDILQSEVGFSPFTLYGQLRSMWKAVQPGIAEERLAYEGWPIRKDAAGKWRIETAGFTDDDTMYQLSGDLLKFTYDDNGGTRITGASTVDSYVILQWDFAAQCVDKKVDWQHEMRRFRDDGHGLLVSHPDQIKELGAMP